MNDKARRDIALFRYGIISPLVSETYDNSKSMKAFFSDAASKTYTNPRGEDIRVTASTIERWYYNYKKNGFDALIPCKRTDTGLSRKLDDDMKAQIRFLKQEYPRLPSTLILQKLIENGTVNKGEVSLSTITRFVNSMQLETANVPIKDMRRYERAHINEVWCGDSSVGPYITIEGKKHKTFIIALLDDASRYIVGIDIFLNDNYINLLSVLRRAVKRYGKPKVLNFDNGSSYKNKQMELMAARIGTTLNYCAPYTPTSKAKIERWFRSMKDLWMSTLRMSEIKSLDELRKSLHEYVGRYVATPHSSLCGTSPQDRFFSEATFIKRLPDDILETSFLLEYERRVSADNVIVINELEYEVPYCYSRKKITLRYSPDLRQVYVVDELTGELTPIKLLNKQDNANVKREKVKLTGGTN